MERTTVGGCRAGGYRTVLALALAGCVVVLAGCNDDPAASAGPKIYANNYSGVLKTSQGDYEFKPTVCSLGREGDVVDIEIHGPGTAPDGELIFFALSSTAETMSVHLGVDKPMAHSDRVLNAGRWHSETFAIETSADDRKFKASDIVLVDWNRQRIDGLASVEIDCSL